MFLTAKVLNSDASLNSFKVLDSADFIPGTYLKVVLRAFNNDEGDRFVPPVTCLATVSFPKTDGTMLDKLATLNSDDRSFMTVTLTSAETTDLIGGNIQFSLDLLGTGAQVVKGWAQNAMRKVTTSC